MATSDRVEDQAFVTLATTDAYAFGAMVLGRSLKRVGTSRQLVVMVTIGVTQAIRQQLCEIFDEIVQVDVLDSRDPVNLDLLSRQDLGVTFTKLHCWRLVQYSKAVFMDADTLVVQNIDDLFEREEFSAAPDAGWPDCFNSGVFVFKPSLETYQSLLQYAVQHGSFDGGDQGLLNLYFGEQWSSNIARHLPFLYNCVSQAFYSYLPAYKQFGKDVKVVHFIGAVKPWHHTYNTATGHVETSSDTVHSQTFLQLWWDVFMADIMHKLDPEMINIKPIGGSSGDKFMQRCMLHLFHKEPPPTCPVADDTPHSSHNHISAKIIPDTSFVTAPYSVPDVAPFYEPTSSRVSTEQLSSVLPVVSAESSPKEESRSYSHYEAFYPDPPMTSKPDYVEPVQHLYEAKAFESTWGDYGKTSDKEHESGDEPDTAILESNLQESESKENENIARESEEAKSKVSGELLQDILLEGGGQLTSLRIEGHRLQPDDFSKEQLDDVARQYSWEKGQIDYLGIDAFSNIQKRLDEVLLSKPVEPEHPDPVQPPILQPPASTQAKAEKPTPRKTILKKS